VFGRIALLFVGCGLLASCFDSRAAEGDTANADKCAATGSNVEHTKCWQDLAKRSRTELDDTFERVQRTARRSDDKEGAGETGDYKNWLSEANEQSQLKWIDFSERQCLTEGRVARGGTGTRTLVAKCQDRLNQQRIGELKNLVAAIEAY
jgi:uncharacterized protein YecT (DUF1311 family)